MSKDWQVQEAKANFSKLINQSTVGEPQVVTVHGKPTVVVISADEYRRLTTRSGSLSAALLSPKLIGLPPCHCLSLAGKIFLRPGK